MARSISTKPATVKSKVQNPYSQPCFATYACQHSVQGCGWILFDHNIEPIAKYVGDGNDYYNQFRTYTSYAPEFFNAFSGNAYQETTSHAGSSSNYGSNTCNNGYLGHQGHVSVTEFTKTAGYLRGWPAAEDKIPYAFRDVNSIVGDIDQDWAWFCNREGSGGNHRMMFSGRNAAKYYHNWNREGANMITIPVQTAAGVTDSSTTSERMYGGSCINTRAKKVCLMQTDGDGRRQPIVYNDVNMDWRAYALANNHFEGTPKGSNGKSDSDSKIYQFFNSSANYTAYDRSTDRAVSYSSAGESYHRSQTCICDNGVVFAFTMTPGHGVQLEKWNANGTYAGMVWNQGWTTSYGYEQGRRFGSRWQVSSSGDYWWAYCPSYYYGSGIYWACVRVKDGKWMYFRNQDSTHGRSLAPLGKNKLVVSRSQNKDDPGTYFRVHDLDHEFRKRNDGAEYSEFDNNYKAYMLDTAGNSTGYPFIVPSMYNTSMFSSQLESNLQ